jgi:gas vesicle protein
MKLKDIRNWDKDRILEMLGLERRQSATSSLLWSLGLIGIGLLAGAGGALFLAPQSGRELREQVGRKLRSNADQVVAAARAKVNQVQAERS